VTLPPQVVCIGGASLDRKVSTLGPLRPGTSNPARAAQAFGGVARNVAETLARLSVRTALVSRVGADEAGRAIARQLESAGVDIRHLVRAPGEATAEYLAVLPPTGNLAYGFALMDIFDAIGPADLARAADDLSAAAFVFADCNLPAATLDALRTARRAGARLAVDAVSTPKAARLGRDLSGIDLLFLNADEAAAILGRDGAPEDLAVLLLDAGARAIVLTGGRAGVVAADAAGLAAVPAVPAAMVDATGAGDALTGTVLAGLVAGRPLVEAVRLGTLAAALTVESPFSVRPDLSRELLAAERHRFARSAPV
jgi:pseudouridine kinase